MNKYEDEKQYYWEEKQSNGHTRVGINEAGQDEIGEISFVAFPKGMTEVKEGDSFVSVEGAKAVSDLHSPVAGKIAKVNTELMDHPEKLDEKGKENTWLVELY